MKTALHYQTKDLIDTEKEIEIKKKQPSCWEKPFDAHKFMEDLKVKFGHESEFLQAVHEVVERVGPFLDEHPIYKKHKILERMVMPERTISFRVTWVDDKGIVQVNNGYRIQFSSILGPYKGGIRFHPSVNQSILKFLGFEQIFKNSLTTLPMGGGKGGSDFDPKGKSDNEVMRFCQAYMTELAKHIGPETDVPAGDIGVGGREIGFMFGQYKRIRNEITGVMTGKGSAWGGSLIRPEATGYGLVYFVENILHHKNDSIKGKVIAVSGSGNVAQFCIQKVNELGGKVITASDSGGVILDEEGITCEKLKYLQELKNERRGRISQYLEEYPKAKYYPNKKPWEVVKQIDIALPCATQNEVNKNDVTLMIQAGVKAVAEGANMPCTPEAVTHLQRKKIIFAPGKASNAGGVAVSGLEMSQNSLKLSWSRTEVDKKLQTIMKDIHRQCVRYGKVQGHPEYIDYVLGANVAGFVKVADAMIDQGYI